MSQGNLDATRLDVSALGSGPRGVAVDVTAPPPETVCSELYLSAWLSVIFQNHSSKNKALTMHVKKGGWPWENVFNACISKVISFQVNVEGDLCTFRCCPSGWSHGPLPGCPGRLLGCHSAVAVVGSESQPAEAGNVGVHGAGRGASSWQQHYLSGRSPLGAFTPLASVAQFICGQGFPVLRSGLTRNQADITADCLNVDVGA